MKFLRFISVAIFCLGLFSTSPAQNVQDEKKNTGWQRLQSPNGEISFAVPKDFVYFYDKDGFSMILPMPMPPPPGPASESTIQALFFSDMRMINSADGKTMMSVEMYRSDKPTLSMKEMIRRDMIKGKKTSENSQGIETIQFESTKVKNAATDRETEVSHITRYIASKNSLYVISVSNRGIQTDESRRFLSSFRFHSIKTEADGKNAIDISTLKAIGVKDIGTNLGAAELDAVKPSDPNVKPAPNPTGAIMVANPMPSFPPSAVAAGLSGQVKLRLNLAENGRISGISFLSVLPPAVNRNCFFAALRIKFIPAEKDGQIISTSKLIQYSFK